jgi:hypothetical protein
MRRIVTLLLLQFLWLTVVRAGEVKATASWSLDFPRKAPPEEVININFSEKGNAEGAVLDLTKGAPLNKASYKLIAVKQGESDEPVEILKITASLQDENKATALNIVPKSLPKKDVTYMLKVEPGTWQFGPGSSYDAAKTTELKLDSANLELDQAFAAPRTLRTKVEIAGGTIGTGSLQIHSGLTQFSGDALWGADFLGKADFSFLARDKKKYLNSLVGELKVFGASIWNERNEDFTGFLQGGLTSRVESDQTFDTVNGTVGVGAGSYIKNPLTTFLHNNAVKLLQGKDIQEAGVAPYLFVAYDYVDHVKKGVAPNTGNNRARFDFDWSLPLLRGYEFPKTLGLTQQSFDADFLVQIEIIYDVRQSKFMDNSKLTLEFRPQTASDKAPSFTLTYAQGKATPTFQHFDALLAGLKIAF